MSWSLKVLALSAAAACAAVDKKFANDTQKGHETVPGTIKASIEAVGNPPPGCMLVVESHGHIYPGGTGNFMTKVEHQYVEVAPEPEPAPTLTGLDNSPAASD